MALPHPGESRCHLRTAAAPSPAIVCACGLRRHLRDEVTTAGVPRYVRRQEHEDADMMRKMPVRIGGNSLALPQRTNKAPPSPLMTAPSLPPETPHARVRSSPPSHPQVCKPVTNVFGATKCDINVFKCRRAEANSRRVPLKAFFFAATTLFCDAAHRSLLTCCAAPGPSLLLPFFLSAPGLGSWNFNPETGLPFLPGRSFPFPVFGANFTVPGSWLSV